MPRLVKRMLATDLDGTLVGDAAALQRFDHWLTMWRDELVVVYVTGRFFAAVAQDVQTGTLPRPDLVVAAVGTVIYDYASGDSWPSWRANVPPAWNAAAVRRLLQNQPRLEPQPELLQSPLKASYFLHQAQPSELEVLLKRVQAAGIAADLIYSSGRDLDFLPAGINKGTAIHFLAKHWQLTAQQVLVCGDTGNDRAMFEQGFPGVVVGNAQPELKQLRGPHIYHAQAAHAGGVLEGISNFWHDWPP